MTSSTLTFFFADLENSTLLLRELGDDYQALLEAYHRIVRRAVDAHSGQVELVEGDGFFCVFSLPSAAVAASEEIQRAMLAEPWPSGTQPRSRIGIHTGQAERTPGGLVGLDVNRAARLGAAAQGGQVLVSAATRALVVDEARRRGWQLVELGGFELKGLSDAEQINRVDFPGVPVADMRPRARRLGSTLPSPTRPIVGRVADLEGAAEMLMRESVRLVTITGFGGTGKTRLAIELGHRLEDRFPGGVVFVDLAAVRAPQQFLTTVGRALGLHESGGRSIAEAMRSVIGSARMLLILDNMEQLTGASADVSEIVEALPNVRILVTSRSPLRLSFENEYPLSPLPVPSREASIESIPEADAVRLFVQRAQAVRPDFALNPSNLSIVAEITRRLDGLPLAIELAAARLRLFQPRVLLERLADRLGLLGRGAADSPERHRTLRAAIQWSHDLLDDDERLVFERLGVFAGGWPLEAALAVCTDDVLAEATVLGLLEELVAKSLVVFAIDESGDSRYRMLETIREFSLEKLATSGEEEELRRRHFRWVESLCLRMEDSLPTPGFSALLDEIERERYNLREAFAWSLRSAREIENSLWICGLLTLYWDTRGYVTEGLSWTERFLAAGPSSPSPGRASALVTIGWLAMLAGDPERSEQAMTEGDHMWRELGDVRGLALSLAMHGMTTHNLSTYDVAEAQLREAAKLAKQAGLGWIADAWCVFGLAHVALARNDLPTAHGMLLQTLEYSKNRGLTWGVGHAQLSLGVLAFMSGDMGQAVERVTESLLVREQLKDARGICDCLVMMALLASVQGDHSLAARLLGAAAVRREAAGQTVVPWQQPLLAEATSTAKAALGANFENEVSAGRVLPAEQAIRLAVARVGALVAAGVS